MHAQLPAEDEKDRLVQIARRIVPKPFIQHPIVVTTTSNVFDTIEPKQLFANIHLVIAINGVVDVSLQQPFYVYVSYLSRNVVRLPKHTVIAETEAAPTVIYAICTKPLSGSRLGTFENHKQGHSIYEENATSGISFADDVATVHYKLKKGELQMTRNQVVQNDET